MGNGNHNYCNYRIVGKNKKKNCCSHWAEDHQASRCNHVPIKYRIGRE